jgi:hypothetical protein
MTTHGVPWPLLGVAMFPIPTFQARAKPWACHP